MDSRPQTDGQKQQPRPNATTAGQQEQHSPTDGAAAVFKRHPTGQPPPEAAPEAPQPARDGGPPKDGIFARAKYANFDSKNYALSVLCEMVKERRQLSTGMHSVYARKLGNVRMSWDEV